MKVALVACLNSIRSTFATCMMSIYHDVSLFKMGFKHATAAPRILCLSSDSGRFTPGRMGQAEDAGDLVGQASCGGPPGLEFHWACPLTSLQGNFLYSNFLLLVVMVSNLTAMASNLLVTPKNSYVKMSMLYALQEGDYEKAAQHFCMALDLRPGFLQDLPARLPTVRCSEDHTASVRFSKAQFYLKFYLGGPSGSGLAFRYRLCRDVSTMAGSCLQRLLLPRHGGGGAALLQVSEMM